MRKQFLYTLTIAAAGLFSSCDKVSGDEPLEMTKPGKLAGEWFVTVKLNGNDVNDGYSKIMTYNTAGNNDSLWVDDLKHIWPFKSKVAVNAGTLTFSAATADNSYESAAKVTIENGKVLAGAGKSTTGAKVDSIYFEASFSDDPGNKYIISGHQRSGFPDDEH